MTEQKKRRKDIRIRVLPLANNWASVLAADLGVHANSVTNAIRKHLAGPTSLRIRDRFCELWPECNPDKEE